VLAVAVVKRVAHETPCRRVRCRAEVGRENDAVTIRDPGRQSPPSARARSAVEARPCPGVDSGHLRIRGPVDEPGTRPRHARPRGHRAPNEPGEGGLGGALSPTPRGSCLVVGLQGGALFPLG